ncbi:hypothetical protein HJFPF1_10111 [Paramyrothecium foliicola]|nr:hypothetical protein HJFPF1_10111 [Paramyrothecium foliicola]
MHEVKQIVYRNIQSHHMASTIDHIYDRRNGATSKSPETEAMLADWSAICSRKGNKNTKRFETAQQAKKKSVDTMSDEQLERVIIRLKADSNPSEGSELKGKTDNELRAKQTRFAKYKHHQFVHRWGLFDDSEGLDEEWYLPSPPILPEDDPEYLCDMCRHINFRALFTQRGLPGNQEPGNCTISVFGLAKVMKSTDCGFCSLLRRKIAQGNLLAAASDQEIEDGCFQLNVLDEGPSRALRLEVELVDMNDERPRFVIQALAESSGQPLQGLPVLPDAASMARLNEWRQHCSEIHSPSNVDHKRFLDQAPSRLRLVDTQDYCVREVESPYEYSCLSYVWGSGSQLQYTTKTRDTLEKQDGLKDAANSLAQTIKDAIEVTRSVGLRYIWVDALCILQDDESDKSGIIKNMHAIYGNAALTIVAPTNSDPLDGIPGISQPRAETQITSRVQGMTLAVVFQDARKRYADIQDSVWNSRAWTFQEKVLSPRSVYFTNSQMYFECPHATIFEDTVPVEDPEYKPLPFNDQTQFSSRQYDLWSRVWEDPTQAAYPNKGFDLDGTTMIMIAKDEDEPDQCNTSPAPIYEFSDAAVASAMNKQLLEGGTMWDMYRRCVNIYTLREMKWQSDAVNAFLGITGLIRQGTNTTFWYGMPEFAFHESLLWYPQEPLKRRLQDSKPLFPSWAWAAWEGHVSYRSRGWFNAIRWAPVSCLRWYETLSPQQFLEIWKDQEHRQLDEVEEMTSRLEKIRVVNEEVDALDLGHVNYKELGWQVHMDEKRNQHIYTHEAYSGVEFSSPICLPWQSIKELPNKEGALCIDAKRGAARFVNMATVQPVPTLDQDRFFQLGLGDEARSSNHRRPWQHIIYHQGYRAGFLSLNVLYEDLDPENDKYSLIAVSRDSLTQIESAHTPWHIYRENDPIMLQHQIFFEEWVHDNVPLRKPVEDAVPNTDPKNESGDPYWDEGRFGAVGVLDVYNVLLLRHMGGYWERIGVGKISNRAFNAVHPEDGSILLR